MYNPMPARVLHVSGPFVKIECPYCHSEHEHKQYTPGMREHRAAACALNCHISPAQRLAGYYYQIG